MDTLKDWKGIKPNKIGIPPKKDNQKVYFDKLSLLSFI